ncbi:hypothetical protein QVD17_33066 [Tagetes erecta]|uniref:Uncharacterized protein n=1 Tax=Tagetes erecta TaxID=13708 RepID=A0AAD8JYD1_TARER|nr:hypothetical protein QVD17_33066 [Tagetes erecta]
MSNTTANNPPPSLSKPKQRVRKQRSAGKKDRHSKIHTAQGLRDRRMRLSLHIARKFFGLQDMLGFDKASKTIEWLFCKSKKAIDEVTESVQSQNTTQSACRDHIIISSESPLSDCEVVDSGIELDAGSNKDKQLKVHDHDQNINAKTDVLARELRGKARARARERTRERMMINDPEKSKQMFGSNASDDNEKLQLGFYANPNNQHFQDSSSSPNEYYPGTHHLFDHTQLNDHAASSSTYFANPPAGWLNSSNTLLGFVGGNWDYENLSENYGLLPNIAPMTADIVHFHQTQNQRE